MSSTMQRLVVLAGVGAIALTGCGSKSTSASSSSSTSTATSSSASTTPAASDASASSTPTASDASASSSASSSASASGAAGEKTYTDAQLAALLKSAKVDGKSLSVASASDLVQLRKGLSSNQLVQVMEKAQVTPAACKASTMTGAKDFSAVTKNPIGAAMDANKRLVVLYQVTSAQGEKVVANNKATGTSCATYTMTMNQSGQKLAIKGASKVLDIKAPSTQQATGQQSTVSVNGQKSAQSSALGTVNGVLVQVSDPKGKATPAELSQELESVAKTVAAGK